MRVVAEKTALRAQALARRAGVSRAVREHMAGHLAATCPALLREKLKRHPLAAAHPVVSVYHPIRDEADTLPLIEALAEDGCKTALPVTVGRRKPLRFLAWRAGEPLRRGALGIAEPLAETEEVDPDVLFVPLAAFDGRGYRLGYGAGHYDTSLARLRGIKPVLAIGIAFAVQQVPEVPTEPHDERLDALVTEAQTFTFGRS